MGFRNWETKDAGSGKIEWNRGRGQGSLWTAAPTEEDRGIWYYRCLRISGWISVAVIRKNPSKCLSVRRVLVIYPTFVVTGQWLSCQLLKNRHIILFIWNFIEETRSSCLEKCLPIFNSP
jgi:hypothetical protein